jgi:predicted transposase/invertase (TIGR01784 family)
MGGLVGIIAGAISSAGWPWTGFKRGKPGMAIGIDPTVDYPFKCLFGNPQHPEIAVHFLNAVLGPFPRIEGVEFLDPASVRKTEDDKLSIFDVRARDNFGRWLNVEMQSTKHAGLPQRLAFYATSMYYGQFRPGESYSRLSPAISICVLGSVLFPSVSDLHVDFRLRNCRHDLVLTDDIQVHFVELLKYNLLEPLPKTCTPLEKWAHFLRRAENLTLQQIGDLFCEPVFLEAAGVLQMIAQTPAERALYEARLKFETDQAWKIQEALKEGRTEGRAEGMVAGLERGEYWGRIRSLQALLGLPESSQAELEAMDIARMQSRLAQLQAQLRDRR